MQTSNAVATVVDMSNTRSASAPRVRMTPEEIADLHKHYERYRRVHPSVTLSEWMRDAISLKIRADALALGGEPPKRGGK